MTKTLRLPINLFRLAAVFGLPLLLATSAAAQSRNEEPAKQEAVAPADAPAPAALEERTDAPTLNSDVKQDLSKAPSSPDAAARREEVAPKEDLGPVQLQIYVEPETPATPQH